MNSRVAAATKFHINLPIASVYYIYMKHDLFVHHVVIISQKKKRNDTERDAREKEKKSLTLSAIM